jgi:hypothetical protein
MNEFYHLSVTRKFGENIKVPRRVKCTFYRVRNGRRCYKCGGGIKSALKIEATAAVVISTKDFTRTLESQQLKN